MNKVIVSYDNPSIFINNLVLCPGVNLVTGKEKFCKEFGTITSLEEDLLILASSIFATDLAVKRGKREEITRKIELTVPLVNVHLFNSIIDVIQYALFKLSHDSWTLNFVQKEGSFDDFHPKEIIKKSKVLLFSGGLDSASAALEFGENGESIQLVSHITGNRTIVTAQQEMYAYLDQKFPNQFNHIAFRVGGRDKKPKKLPFPVDKDREDTQRTRSFLFLSLAALVARRKGIHEVVVIAENGQLAINLPLTASRISAFSTHTAHPEFLSVMSNILSKVLNFDIKIHNPYLYLTKAEVVKALVKSHPDVIDKTVSCWKASRVVGQLKHCGYCVPCLIRRVAIEYNGATKNEYKRDLFLEDLTQILPDDEGLKNIKELALFIEFFSTNPNQAKIIDEYPDLINTSFDSEKATKLYKRFSKEALKVFGKYPNVLEIFG